MTKLADHVYLVVGQFNDPWADDTCEFTWPVAAFGDRLSAEDLVGRLDALLETAHYSLGEEQRIAREAIFAVDAQAGNNGLDGTRYEVWEVRFDGAG